MPGSGFSGCGGRPGLRKALPRLGSSASHHALGLGSPASRWLWGATSSCFTCWGTLGTREHGAVSSSGREDGQAGGGRGAG